MLTHLLRLVVLREQVVGASGLNHRLPRRADERAIVEAELQSDASHENEAVLGWWHHRRRHWHASLAREAERGRDRRRRKERSALVELV